MEWSCKGRPDAHGDEQDEQRHDEGDDEFGSHRLRVVEFLESGSSRWFDLGFGVLQQARIRIGRGGDRGIAIFD